LKGYESAIVLAAPYDLTATSLTGGMELNWKAPTGMSSVTYDLYIDGVKSNSEPINGTTYVADNLVNGQQYEFYVVGVDKYGNETEQSGTVVAAPTNTQLEAPIGLTATAGDGAVELQWGYSGSATVTYDVYMDGTKINTNPVENTIYTVDNLVNGQEYQFYVVAVDMLDNESQPSNTESAIPKEGVSITGYSLSFNGTDQYALMGTFGNFGADHHSDFTMEAKFTSNDALRHDLIGVYQQRVSSANVYGQFLFMTLNQIGDIDINVRDDFGNQIQAYANVGFDINDGSPHMISSYIDGANATVKLYLDGTPISVSYNNRAAFTGTTNWNREIGLGVNNHHGGLRNYHNGTLDEVRFWIGERTEQDIAETLGIELSPSAYPNLFRYYKCNDGAGDQLTEEVAAEHGTLYGNVNDNMWETV
jgi:hypothetical protein